MKNILKIAIIGLMLAPLVSLASIDQNLSYGSTGSQVLELQDFLNAGGYLSVNPTGNFYSLTLKAVEAYQSDNNIPSTGYVGKLTRASINAELTSELASSTDEQIQETGTTTLPEVVATTSPVVSALQQQNILLQQQLAAQQQTNQLLQLQASSSQNSVVNTPVIVSAPAPTFPPLTLTQPVCVSTGISQWGLNMKNAGYNQVLIAWNGNGMFQMNPNNGATSTMSLGGANTYYASSPTGSFQWENQWGTINYAIYNSEGEWQNGTLPILSGTMTIPDCTNFGQ